MYKVRREIFFFCFISFFLYKKMKHSYFFIKRKLHSIFISANLTKFSIEIQIIISFTFLRKIIYLSGLQSILGISNPINSHVKAQIKLKAFIHTFLFNI